MCVYVYDSLELDKRHRNGVGPVGARQAPAAHIFFPFGVAVLLEDVGVTMYVNREREREVRDCDVRLLGI